jgi:hypothetical protein
MTPFRCSLEATQSSSYQKWLMQIDTMVICGMLSMEKQYDLREKLVINRDTI